jgi:hypothetical protein
VLRGDELAAVPALAVFNALRGWLAARLQEAPETT